MKKKTEFLILRIDETLKKRIIQKAEKAGESVSGFIRQVLDKVL